LPSNDRVGNAPVASVYNVPVCLSAKAAYQNTLLDPSNGSLIGIKWAVVRWALGWTLDGSTCTLGGCCFGSFFLVLLMPARGRFIRPFEVAGDFAKFFFMISAFIKGMPSSWPLDTVLRSVGMGALKND